jgi:hypothetical protein
MRAVLREPLSSGGTEQQIRDSFNNAMRISHGPWSVALIRSPKLATP